MTKVIEPTPEEIDRLSALLLRCPFCNSPARIDWTPVPNFAERSDEPASIAWCVECQSTSRCPMGKHFLCSTQEAAVRAWNQRL